MRFFVFYTWSVTLLTISGKPLPSDTIYNDFYLSDSGLPEDSLFGDAALGSPSLDGPFTEETSSLNAYDDGSLWASTSGDGNYDILPQDDDPQSTWGQDLAISEDPGVWMSSCDGAEIQKRDNMRTRDVGACSPADAPLNFKVPTLPPTLPKTPFRTEIKPTLGRLRLGFPPVTQDPLCSVEPYELHLCCDGPVGDEAMDFGGLEVFTPVKGCIPGTIGLCLI